MSTNRPSQFPPRRAARIAASMDLEPEHVEGILDASGLTAESWEKVQDDVDAQLAAAVGAGREDAYDDYDQAYVGRIEEERGTITTAELAEILVAEERDRLSEVLDSLGIPAAAYPVVVRFCVARETSQEEAHSNLRTALEHARELRSDP